MNAISADGRDVLDLIRRYANLEWSKALTRYQERDTSLIASSEDQSTHIPYVSFRLKCENDALIDTIRSAISSFDGRLEWTIESRERKPLPGRNWSIYPKILQDFEVDSERIGLSKNDYVRQKFPEMGAMGHDDMGRLFGHLRDRIRKSGLVELNQQFDR